MLNPKKIIILADQAIVSGSTILTQFLAVQCLGLHVFGKFSAIVLVQLFLLSLQQAGVTAIYTIQHATLTTEQKKSYLSGLLALELSVAGTIAIISIACYPLYSHTYSTWEYSLLPLNIILFLLQDFFRKIFLADDRIADALVIDIINNVLQVAGILLLLVLRMSSLPGVLLVCGTSFVPAIAYALIRWKDKPNHREIAMACSFHARETKWLLGSALLQWVSGNFFVVAAGWWLGASALGILRLGQYIFGAFNVLLQAIENYLLPRAGAMSANPDATIIYLKSVQKKMLLYIGLGLGGIILLAHPVLNHLYPAESGNILTVMYGMCAVYLFVIAGYPVRIALRSLKHNNIFFRGYVINAVFGLSTAYLLINYWGLAGVLWGLFLSQAILFIYWSGVLQVKYRAIWK